MSDFYRLFLFLIFLVFLMFSTPASPNNTQQSMECDEKNKVCYVILSDEIKGISYYLSVSSKIRRLGSDWKVEFDVIGYGGSTMGALLLINTIKNSDATVRINVLGPVYSEHANLAISGDEIKIIGDGFFMFHRSAMKDKKTGEYVLMEKACDNVKGLDRGIRSKIKCELGFKNFDKVLKTVLGKTVDIMTPKERLNYENGHDIYVSFEDMRKRIEDRGSK